MKQAVEHLKQFIQVYLLLSNFTKIVYSINFQILGGKQFSLVEITGFLFPVILGK